MSSKNALRLFSSFCSKTGPVREGASPGKEGFPHQRQTLPTTEQIPNLPLPGPPSQQAQRFLQPEVLGVVLSHPKNPEVLTIHLARHLLLPLAGGTPPAVLLGANQGEGNGTATRYLPFFAGAGVGALSLAAWECNASPSPYQAPYQQAPSQLPGAKLQQDRDLLLPPNHHLHPPHTWSTSPPTFPESMPTPPTPSSSSSSASMPSSGNDLNHLTSSLSSSLANGLSRSNSEHGLGSGWCSGLSGSLGLTGLSNFGSRWGPSMREGYSSWMGMWPPWASKGGHSDPMHIVHPQPPVPSKTSPTQPNATHSIFPPPLPPPCTSSPQQAHQSAVPPTLQSPCQAPCNNSGSSCSSCSCSFCQEQHHDARPVPLTRTSISDASARVAPAVVHLMVESAQPGFQQQQQQQQQLQQGCGVGGMGVVAPGRSSGSGFVYDARGFILTNAHVVDAAAAEDSQGGLAGGAHSRIGGSNASSSGSSSGKVNGWLGWGLGGGFKNSSSSSRSSSSDSSDSSCYSSSSGSLRKQVSEGGRSPQVPPGVLTVTLQDGRILKGLVVCLDRAADVAVVKVDSPEPLPVAPMGGVSKLRVGEWVVALGSPLMLKHSVTAGIVSCVERRGHELGLPGSRSAYIQTDVAINQGNSGGPLINLDGEVVGMSMMKAVAADGVSFCLPISAIQDIVSSFSTHGRMRYPYVGITMVEITNQGTLRQVQPDLPELLGGSSTAVMVQSVHAGSPAHAAGLQPEDIIVSLDGRMQLSMNDAVEQFGASIHKPCALGVLRRGVNADGTVGPYAMLSMHLTPSEHRQE